MLHYFNIKWDASKDQFLNDFRRRGYDKLDYITEFDDLEDSNSRPKNLAEYDEHLKYQEIYNQIYPKNMTELQRFESIASDNLKNISNICKIIEQSYTKKMYNEDKKFAMAAYLNIEPEHENNDFAFFKLFNWFEESNFTNYILNKYLCFVGVSYVTANPMDLNFNSGSIRNKNYKRILNKNWDHIRNNQKEKNKLKFDIDIIFDDQNLDLTLHVNHIEGQWVFKNMVESGKITNRIGKKIFFSPFFMPADETQNLICDVVYF